ncbi:MAG TPA: creatininase family protein [Nakamurella sp.]|nr:creatininase family protein [Nakamurella sp.]
MPRFDELTRDDLRRLAPEATVLIPLGSIEQHGPHLPVCVDTAVVSHLVDRAAQLAAEQIPVVVTPTLPFGFANHHLAFGGTISIDLPVYLDVLTSIGRSLAVDGFRRILFINGHGGNDAPVRAVGDRLVHELGLDVLAGGTSYWTCAADALRDLDLDVGPVPGHAGGFETSCLMALRPDLVRTDRLPAPEQQLQPLAEVAMPGAAVRRAGVWEASDGRTDDSSRATPEIGERALAAIATRLAEFVIQFHHAAR